MKNKIYFNLLVFYSLLICSSCDVFQYAASQAFVPTMNKKKDLVLDLNFKNAKVAYALTDKYFVWGTYGYRANNTNIFSIHPYNTVSSSEAYLGLGRYINKDLFNYSIMISQGWGNLNYRTNEKVGYFDSENHILLANKYNTSFQNNLTFKLNNGFEIGFFNRLGYQYYYKINELQDGPYGQYIDGKFTFLKFNPHQIMNDVGYFIRINADIIKFQFCYMHTYNWTNEYNCKPLYFKKDYLNFSIYIPISRKQK